MTEVIVAPGRLDKRGYLVFLAGAIDMGEAEDWQAKVIDSLQGIEKLVILNPRREQFSAETLDEQIRWELDALERASTIFMWFPSASKAPISFFEAGLYWKHSKLIVGAAHDFYRRRNLELTAERYGQTLFPTLGHLIVELEKRIARFYDRT